MAVDQKLQIAIVTDTTKTDIVDAPQSNRTRLIPIGGIVVHNFNVVSGFKFDVYVDDNGTSRIIYGENTTLLPGATAYNVSPIILMPTQKLQFQMRDSVNGANIHVSFLEHRPT